MVSVVRDMAFLSCELGRHVKKRNGWIRKVLSVCEGVMEM